MNELDLLRGQLDTEMRHFSAVSCACGEVLQKEGSDADGFLRACLGYLAFAAERLQVGRAPDSELTQALRSAQVANGGAAAARQWPQLGALLERQLQARQAAIRAARQRGATIAEWRALARLDADSIVREREQYQLLRQSRPADLTPELP